jgi:hypothetical protein
MMIGRRLQALAKIWPVAPCHVCRERPAVFCIAHQDDLVPAFREGRCPECGRLLYSVPILVGVDCDAI